MFFYLTAASLCKRENILPKELSNRISLLQNTLIKDDCYIPGMREKFDVYKNAKVKASSFKEGYNPENVINGYQRNFEEKINMWSSLKDDKEKSITILLENEKEIDEVIIDFNSNLSREIMITQVTQNQKNILNELPHELVKDYVLTLYNKENKIIYEKRILDNIQRHNVHKFTLLYVKKIKVQVLETYGAKEAQIFNIKAYKN